LYFDLFIEDIISCFLKKNQPGKPFRPAGLPVFFGSGPVYTFFPGSLADRFYALPGPDSGPVPGLTG
jgi:hypothetical protein